MRTAFLTAAVCAAGLFLAGCDAAPGARSDGGTPPRLSAFSYSPQSVVLEQVPPQNVSETTVEVPFEVSVQVSDPDGDLSAVVLVVQRPNPNAAPVVAGTLSALGGGRYGTTGVLTLPKAEVGNYTVLVYAQDEAGARSDEYRGLLRYLAAGKPPVIEKVEAFPEVLRPPTELKLVVTVSDPDGLENVAKVVGLTPNNTEFELFDDGRSRGDETAGDGRYTATFDVPSATPGTQRFTFQAFDKSGLASEVVEKTITIE